MCQGTEIFRYFAENFQTLKNSRTQINELLNFSTQKISKISKNACRNNHFHAKV